MKTGSFNLWIRLTLGSAIGALIYHLSPESKTKKLRKMVRAKQHRRENDVKSEIYTLSADAAASVVAGVAPNGGNYKNQMNQPHRQST